MNKGVHERKLIALNYIYLSPKHAGGKDQVGLNLLKGLQNTDYAENMCVICFDYSYSTLKAIAPSFKIITIPSKEHDNELIRMIKLCYVNTFIIPHIIKDNNIGVIYHLSCNTGLTHYSIPSIVIPHDIKAVAHRTLANVKISFYKYFLYKLMYYMDFKTNDHIIAISDVDKTEISNFYPKFAYKVTRIYNPIDVEPPEAYELTKKSEYIIAINLQFHHKNIITLIKAFELIKDKTDVQLYLVGSLPGRVQYLKDYVDTHGLSNRINFTGFIDDYKRNDLLKNAALYINPSLYEGFGMTAVEAIIKGVPTLLSDIPTNREITMDLCEYYCPPEDINQLAHKILYCLNKKYNKDELSSASQRLYNRYNLDVISGEYISYFHSLLK